ncbi:hypothetical protein ABEO98_22810 [Brevibacillus parabrevis]|uniref:hypothetical protein n=1 Tax=Brevibacillus parabrevis TaxID=54914 RepID=UPI003D1C5220
MRIKWIVSIVTVVTTIFMSLGIVSAEATTVAQQNQVQVPDSVKTLDDLVEYLQSQGVLKTDSDILNYMKNNKGTILKVSPNLIDYGFTTRFYTETNTPTRDDGRITITHDFGNKDVQVWTVPFSVTNNSDQTVEFSKDNLALVPKYIPEGKELYVLAIEPEYIMDATSGKILGNFEFPPNREVHLNAVFYVFPLTDMQSVNLRVYDSKDHADIGISKEQ